MKSELNNSELIFDVCWDRISQITGWKNYGQLAEFLNIKPSSVSGAKKRGFISLEWLFKVAQHYKTSTDWLATGEGEKKRLDKATYLSADGFKTTEISCEPGEGFVQVPRYEVAASAGAGVIIHSEQIVDHLSFKSEWVHNSLGVPVASLALINVTGDSMEPTLSEGDLILIDMSHRGVKDNAVYVLQLNGALLVKRIQHKLDGSVIVKSDNAIYEPERVGVEAVDNLNVIGRVVWCGRRM